MKQFLILSIIALALLTFHGEVVAANSISHFGLVVNTYNEDWKDPEKTTKLLKELGVKLVITKLSWKDIEPEKGKYSQKGWEKFDGLVNRLSSLGIEIMPFISATPQWAIDPKLSPAKWKGKKFGPPAKNPEDLAVFFTQVVKRYKDKIKLWALYNAPQNQNHWTEPEVLAEMYRQGQQVLDKYQPEGKLVMSGLEGAKNQGIPYLEKFLKAGGGKYVDMYDFHMTLGGDALSGVEFNTSQYKNVLRKYGELSKPIQYGAFGWPSKFTPSEKHIAQLKRRGWKPIDYAPMTPEQQARILVDIMVLGRTLGVERIFWTRTRDKDPARKKSIERLSKTKQLWVISTTEGNGIIDYSYNVKPSFTAFKVLIKKLDKANVFRDLNLGDNGRGIIFKEGDKFTGVFFTWEKEKTLMLKSSAKNIKIFDVLGKEKETVSIKDGLLMLRISPDPVYVEGDLHDLSVSE